MESIIINMEVDKQIQLFREYYQQGNLQQVESLLSKGELEENFDFPFFELITLEEAIDKGDAELVKILLKYGAKVNPSSELLKRGDFKPPLNLACEQGHYDIVELLINSGANVNSRDRDSEQPLDYAVSKKHVSIVRLLLENDGNFAEDVDEWTYYDGLEDFDEKALNILKLLIDYKIVESFHDLLFVAIVEEKINLLKLLMAKGVNINSRNIFKNSEVNEWSPLGFACLIYSHRKVVEILLKSGGNPNMICVEKSGIVPLMRSSKISLIDTLLKFGANINLQDKKGNTALHHSVHKSIVTFLISRGVDTEIKNKFNQTARELFEYVRDNNESDYIDRDLDQFYYDRDDIDNDFVVHYDACMCEISQMKSIVLSVYGITVHSIMLMNRHQLSRYVNNINLKEIIEKKVFDKKFPIFGAILKKKVKKGKRRNVLITKAAQKLNYLTGIKIPELISYALFKYLSDGQIISAFLRDLKE